MDELRSLIREVPDYPEKGITYYDITTLLKDTSGLRRTLDAFVDMFSADDVDKVVGIESRGFIFAPLLAYHLEAGFVPVRKAGKLPAETISRSYELEYGIDRLEMHKDGVADGDRVLIVDDVIATGGTAAATAGLVRACQGSVVGFGFVVELTNLDGRAKLDGLHVESLVRY